MGKWAWNISYKPARGTPFWGESKISPFWGESKIFPILRWIQNIPRFEVNPKYFLSVFSQAVPGGLAWRVKTWLRICEVLENENILKLFWSCEVLEHNLLILCSCCSTWCTCRKYNLVQNIILSNLNQTLYRLARTQIMINTQLSNPSIDIWIKWHLKSY